MGGCDINDCYADPSDYCAHRSCCFKQLPYCNGDWNNCCLGMCKVIHSVPTSAVYTPICGSCIPRTLGCKQSSNGLWYRSTWDSVFTELKCQQLFGSTCPTGCTACPTCPPGTTCPTCPTCPSDVCDCDCGGDCCFNGLSCEGTDCPGNVEI